MKATCGIFLYSTINKGFLIGHPTRHPWDEWSIPKGMREDGESDYQAAIREMYEETSLKIQSDINILEIHKFPTSRYKSGKKSLESFLIITDFDLKTFKFECLSFVQGDLSFPEIDKFKIGNIKDLDMLHITQKKHINEIVNLISKY